MKNIYTSLSAACLLLLTASSYAQTQTAPVSVVKQEQDQWCWAADSKCILDYYGFVNSQCTIVEYARTVRPGSYFGTKNCCPVTSGVCNKPNEIDQNYGIKGMIDHFGQLKSVVSQGALTVSKIVSELTAKRPFVIGVFWNGGGGHVIVGCGYNQTTGAITFMDSWQNNGMTTKQYSGGTAFSTNTGSGTWAENLVLLTSPTGIRNTDDYSNAVTIFPTPSSVNDEVTINSDYNLQSINVFNNIGQLVNSYTSLSSNSFSINIPDPGFYSVQVITAKGITHKKIVIQ